MGTRGPQRGTGGRPKKALADKILEGNPSKRKLMVLDYSDMPSLEGQVMPPPRDYLKARQKNGKEIIAAELYEKTWNWLAQRNCANFVLPIILEQYAMSVSRWIQCEECITEYGFLAKHPTTGQPMPSPYVSISHTFMKQANNLWAHIFAVMRENCSSDYSGKTPHDDVMERLLTMKRNR